MPSTDGWVLPAVPKSRTEASRAGSGESTGCKVVNITVIQMAELADFRDNFKLSAGTGGAESTPHAFLEACVSAVRMFWGPHGSPKKIVR